MMRKRSEIEALLYDVLSLATAPHAKATFEYKDRLATRFAENAITQNLSGEEESISLTVAFGSRHGSSITNRIDAESLAKLVTRTEAIARNSPQDPEYVAPPGPQQYPVVPKRFFDNVLAITPEELAGSIGKVTTIAKAEGYQASGLIEAGSSARALANSNGLFAYDQHTDFSFSTTIHGPCGSGSASGYSNSKEGVDAEILGEKALRTAISAQNPETLEPGDYTVIMEPQAVVDFLVFLPRDMDARDADEGTTVFADKTGAKLFSSQISISTEIDDPGLPAAPFGEDGLPAKRTVWVQDGRIKRLRHDRYWAQQKKTEPDPILDPIFISGGKGSVEDLVRDCRRGLMVKKLWYIRYVDRKELLLTGMTRNGLFLVENGKIVRPVGNLRFNESPVVFLQNVVSLSEPQYIGGWAKVPAIMSEGFTFSSTTDSL